MMQLPPRRKESVKNISSSRTQIFLCLVVLLVFGGLISGVTAIKSASAGKTSNTANSELAARSQAELSDSMKQRDGKALFERRFAPARLLIDSAYSSMLAPVVTATKTDALIGDDGDAKADPGETIRYTVQIGASGMDATGVAFNDTLDPNTMLVPGSVMTTPIARNDSYNAAGNVRITVAAPGVLANDNDADAVGPAITATAGTFLSTQGGNVNLSADGSFTYNPPAGYEGADSFTYTLNDNEGNTDTATVNITISGMIWFINNNASSCLTLSAGCGRLTNPFSTLAAFQALNNGTGNNPAANDNIFVYESATDYVGPVTLLNGQKFVGQDATATLSSITGVTPPAGSDPLPATSPGAPIVNITSAGIGITVGQNNTLRGFTGGNSSSDIDGTGFGTLNVSDVTLNGNGRALNLSTGTVNGAFGSISSTNSATTGITLTSVAGSLSSGSTTITNPTGIGIAVNTSSAALNFANTAVTGSGGTGVSLATNSGAITFGSLGISPDANQRGLLATDNTNTITATSGPLVTSGAAAVEITRASSTTPLALALTSITTTGGPNGILLRNTSGSFAVNGDGVNTSLGGNGSGGTISGVTGADAATGGNGVYLENAGNITLRRLTINGTNQNNGIRGFLVNNFTLEYSTVNGTNGTASSLPAPNNAGEGSVYFGNTATNGLTGTGTVTNCVFGGGRSRNFSVINTAGTLNRLTITGSTFGLNQSFVGASGDNFSVEARNNGTVLNATVRGSTFSGSPGDLVEFVAQQGTSMDVIFGGASAGQPNTLSNNHPQNIIGGGGMTVASAGSMTFNISNNTMRDANGSAVTFQLAAPLAGSTEFRSLNGTFNANTIGAVGVAGSGSATGNGIFLSFADNATAPRNQATISLTNNTIRNYNGNAAIFADNTGGSYDVNATITGNTATNPGPSVFTGLAITAGAISSADDIDVCANISGNNFSTAGGASDDIFVGVSTAASTMRLPGLAAPATQIQIQNFVLANNNVAGTTVVAFADAPATFAANFLGGAACTAPSVASLTESEEPTVDWKLFPDLGRIPDRDHIRELTQGELDWMVHAAMARWNEAGISVENLIRMQGLTFEITDLPDGQLAAGDSDRIFIDRTAAGYGWYVDASPSNDDEFELVVPEKELQALESSSAYGKIDLLTAVTRELGTRINIETTKLSRQTATLMEGSLGESVRRAPILKIRDPEPSPLSDITPISLINDQSSPVEIPQTGAKQTSGAGFGLESVGGVNLTIGDLPAGKNVTITFDVTVNGYPLPNNLSNQGTVTGSNFTNILTDDPAVAGAADPTLTPVDQPNVSVAVSPASVLEDGADNLVYTFTREGPTDYALTVNFDVGGTSTFSTDYSQTGATTYNGTTGTVVIPIGSSTVTVTIDPTADLAVEADETAILTVATGTGYDVGTPSSANATITNDDTEVSVAVSPTSVSEDGVGNLVYTFTRVGVTSGPLTVNFSIGGTATFNTDYTQTGAATFTPPSGTVTFGAGNTTVAVTIDPTADASVEPDETVSLTVAAGTGYNVGSPAVASGTIANDDADVSVAVAPSSVAEDGVGNLVFTFTRTGFTGGALTVNFSIAGTATFTTDYTQVGATTFAPPSGTVTFGAGNSTATVTVDPVVDTTSEPDETVAITVDAGVGYNVVMPTMATGTIIDDDNVVTVAVAPSAVNEDGATNLVYTFTRTNTVGAQTVNFSVGGTATFSTDYTQTGAVTFTASSGTAQFADGSATTTVTVDPTADSTLEPDETVILTATAGTGYVVGMPAAATGTITNDDTDVSVAVAPSSVTEDGVGNLVFTFTRAGVTTGSLTVNFSVGGTSAFNTDYTQTGADTFTPPTGTVQFAAGSSTATVTIDPTADTTVEPDETVILTVAAGIGYNVAALNNSATGTITNDDTDVSIAVAPAAVAEDGVTNLVYTFTRTGVTSTPLTVNFAIGGTATFSTDYTQVGAATFVPPNGTATFGAGNSTATVTVDPSADITSEPDETVILTLAAGTGYNVGIPSSATGTITNDDVVVSVAVSPGAVDEDGAANLIYTFTRNDSNGALIANFSIGGTATFNTDYTQTGAATFVPPNGTVSFADGELTTTVTVDPVADSALEPDETVVLTVVAGAGYGVGAPSSATGTITNDDTEVSVAVSPSSTLEDGAGNLVYTFTRAGVTTGALTVNFSVGGTSTFNTDYTQTGAATFTPPTGTVQFAAGSSTATVTIDPTADSAVESDETVILSVAAGAGYNIAAANNSATGTITNDDTDVSIAVSPTSVAEDGAPNLVYTFTRVGVTTGPLTVNFAIGGTATFSVDYTQVGAATFLPPNGTVIFGAGNSTATVTVNPSADITSEPDETVILTLAAGTGYNIGTPSSATGTILNDDAADVEITAKTDTPDPVCVGQNITYTIGFRNNAAGPTANGKVSDTIPANTTFVSATLPAGWSRADSVVAGGTGTLMFTKASVNGGETATFTVVVNINTGTTGGTIISNTATASSDFPDDVPGNNSKTATTTVDPTPPVISGLSADPASLWPKNHKMRDVTINYTATDGCSGVSCQVTNITSNEPINGTGDGDTAPDWQFVDEHHVRLRAESAGGSIGRIYTVTVTCVDAAGNSTTRTVEVHVGHNILTPASGTAFKINTAVTFTGTFWDIPGKKHTAVWQFDDLTTGATVVEPAGSKNGTAKGTYTFRTPGVYKVTLKVTDNTGVTSSVDTHNDVEAIVVVYDPASGYTIGGGWINSPLGALVSDPTITGKMSFGYNSKFFRSATNPKGELQLDFLLGDFEFNALNYEYLVIDQARAQFHGFGKVNGVSGYDFIATVIDGSLPGGGGVDKFRIKIWEKTTGIVVYDNQMGASDAADPIVPIGPGGDIVIKK